MRYLDQYSQQADRYAASRPRYPAALFESLASLSPGQELAWDCATGSGQAAMGLVEHFERVIATDASAAQLKHAPPHARIEYRVAPAEASGLLGSGVDVLTVAQAVHWFDLDAFYAEAKRVLRPNGILAVWCYQHTRITPAVDRVTERYYAEIVAADWAPQIHWVDEHYRTLPFPFEELPAPTDLAAEAEWALSDLTGYLESWSATQRYRQRRGEDPIHRIGDELRQAWGARTTRHAVRWPLYVRIGRQRPFGV